MSQTKTRDKLDPAVVGMPLRRHPQEIRWWLWRAETRLECLRRCRDLRVGGGRSTASFWQYQRQGRSENIIPAGNFTLVDDGGAAGTGQCVTHARGRGCVLGFEGPSHHLCRRRQRAITSNNGAGPWGLRSCPAGVIHGYQNNTVETVYLNVMVPKGKPEL